MDDAKIDESISSISVMVISSCDIVYKNISFNHRSVAVVVTCIPEIGTQSTVVTVQKSAPIFGAEIRTVYHQLYRVRPN